MGNERMMLDIMFGFMMILIVISIVKFSATGEGDPYPLTPPPEVVEVELVIKRNPTGRQLITFNGTPVSDWPMLRSSLAESGANKVNICTDDDAMNRVLYLVTAMNADAFVHIYKGAITN